VPAKGALSNENTVAWADLPRPTAIEAAASSRKRTGVLKMRIGKCSM